MIFTNKCACCSALLKFTDNPGLCPECEKKIKVNINTAFADGDINRIIIPFLYDGAVADMILMFKFRNRTRTGRYLADMTAKAVSDDGTVADITAVACVPSHKSAKKPNQSEFLARKAAKNLGVPFYNLLIKIKNNKSQTLCKNSSERLRNAEGVFGLNHELLNKLRASGKNPVEDGRILIIDDVYTTGATLKACAETLISAGARRIYAAAAALTPPFRETAPHFWFTGETETDEAKVAPASDYSEIAAKRIKLSQTAEVKKKLKRYMFLKRLEDKYSNRRRRLKDILDKIE